jgi:hypothetical protein
MNIGNWKFRYSSPEVELQFISSPKKICIASHTTPFIDGILLYLALCHFGETNLQIYGRGLFSCGFFPWYTEIDRKGGFVKKEIEVLSKYPSFCRVIFPSGGTIYWKTGFYLLAKECNANIIVIGIDYSKREVVVDSVVSTETFIKTECITRLRKYSPGPFYIFLRIFCNYGCETFPVDNKFIFFVRFISISISIYLYTSRFLQYS